ncbi:nitrilase family protein [Flagellimonas halotolerans]|uniref:Nitrilase family protein n=1 Tax=Flagellimonas halotolerans TaxID=3112164 RepID=A0ABU6IP77_9FLAO|nr:MULTISPECIES: nitrilase family protein [unclassified Allomuricauda]MEC3964760.1 nitrilase family protein [Muricauda sp. SYSU M86414]MEC4264876.1 nitrilase family protein [Muricauda sp. SYSU M84420]
MSTTLNIALIQSNLYWEDPVKNRKMFEDKIDTIPDYVDLIVLPEMFTTGFTMKPKNIAQSEGDGTVEWMKRMAQQYNVAMVGSIIFLENGKFFNRLYFVPPVGTLEIYDKKHTFTLAGEDEVYEAGKEKLIFEYKGFSICPMICYDLRFPVWSRNTEDYDVLIYVANWPKKRINAWDTLLKARAVENMAYCIGVNRIGTDGADFEYPGHSAVYDVLGEPMVYSEAEEILYATLDKAHIENTRKKLRFLEDRDSFNLIG